MREESKTGGALGQVAVQELEMLQATIASLDTAQSPKQLLENLDAVDRQYVRAMGAYATAMQEKGGQGGNSAESRIGASDLPPPAALQQLREGKITTFANGERWTVKNGQAIRVQ